MIKCPNDVKEIVETKLKNIMLTKEIFNKRTLFTCTLTD